MSVRPGDCWRKALTARALPQSILDKASEPQTGLEPEMFRWRPEDVGSDRDAEIVDYVQALQPSPQTVVALWWPGAA